MAREAMTVAEALARAADTVRVAGAAEALAEQVARLAWQLDRLNAGGAAARAAQAREAKDSAAESAANVVRGSAGIGLALSPVISFLAGLFGGGREKAPPPLMKFALPEPVRLSAGVSGEVRGGPFAVDYAQGGLPRPIQAPAQVTLQVQAIDSRSFLDHSGEIARAVRQAMLESGVLSDLI
jgi:hypothetical protein